LGVAFTAVWLIYLIQPAAILVANPYGMPYRVIGLAIIGVFSVLYVSVVPNWHSSPRYALPTLAVLAMLAAAACVWYGGMGMETLWIFVSSASGLLIPAARRTVAAVLAVACCYVGFSVLSHVSRTNLLVNLLPAVFIGLAMIGFRRQFELTAALARAREEVAQLAASEERLRLARDMHDLTGQSLSTITLKSELAAKLLGRLPAGPERDRIREEIEQVATVSRQTLRDIREALSGYRRPTLAVEVITGRAALESAGITPHDDPALTMLSGSIDPDAEAALAWCLREAVTNVIRHSGAANCTVTLTRQPRTLSLEVRDDGHGHIPADQAPAAVRGSGLRGMAERLSAVGGRLDIRPHSGPGFTLIAAVPR
jgi:two-component system sensor histidine kinase DesK